MTVCVSLRSKKTGPSLRHANKCIEMGSYALLLPRHLHLVQQEEAASKFPREVALAHYKVIRRLRTCFSLLGECWPGLSLQGCSSPNPNPDQQQGPGAARHFWQGWAPAGRGPPAARVILTQHLCPLGREEPGWLPPPPQMLLRPCMGA